MTSAFVNTQEQILSWLQGEEAYQQAKYQGIYAPGMQGLSEHVFDKEIPERWQQSAETRADCTYEAIVQSNQLLLKMLAAARAPRMFEGPAVGVEQAVRIENTRDFQADVVKKIYENDLPQRPWLYEPGFDLVFESREPNYLFSRTAALAIRALLESQAAFADGVESRPGHPTGFKAAWDYDPPVVIEARTPPPSIAACISHFFARRRRSSRVV
jgi:hypothetical protein